MVCTDIVWYGTAEQDHATRVQKKQNTNGFPYCGCVNVSKPSKTRFSVSRLKPAERKRYYRLFFIIWRITPPTRVSSFLKICHPVPISIPFFLVF